MWSFSLSESPTPRKERQHYVSHNGFSRTPVTDLVCDYLGILCRRTITPAHKKEEEQESCGWDA